MKDSKLLLAHILNKPLAYVYAHPNPDLNDEQQAQFDALNTRLQQGEPLAYLTGEKEFWSLTFKVTKDALIPRPDTELLVESVLLLLQREESRLNCLELGTGSGAISIALKHENPKLNITATDISDAALNVAKENAIRILGNNHDLKFLQSDWFNALDSDGFDIIVSNPPYIADTDPHLKGEIRYEPLTALTSGKDGLDDIKHIIKQAKQFLKPGGILIFEHGYDQGAKVRTLFTQAGYQNAETLKDLSGNDRVTKASFLT